jgi:hypothetical protein
VAADGAERVAGLAALIADGTVAAARAWPSSRPGR